MNTLPPDADGHMKRPRSRRLENRHALWSKEEAILHVVNASDAWTSAKDALIWLDEIAKNTL